MIAARHARALSAMYTERFGLTLNTWKVLSVVGCLGPLSATEAGSRASLEADKVTRAVDALAGQGFVLRRQDAEDRRRVILSLSTKGRRVHDAVAQVHDAMEREFLSVLAPVEIAALCGILDKLDARATEIFADRKAWRAIVDRRIANAAPARQVPQRPASTAPSSALRRSA